MAGGKGPDEDSLRQVESQGKYECTLDEGYAEIIAERLGHPVQRLGQSGSHFPRI